MGPSLQAAGTPATETWTERFPFPRCTQLPHVCHHIHQFVARGVASHSCSNQLALPCIVLVTEFVSSPPGTPRWTGDVLIHRVFRLSRAHACVSRDTGVETLQAIVSKTVQLKSSTVCIGLPLDCPGSIQCHFSFFPVWCHQNKNCSFTDTRTFCSCRSLMVHLILHLKIPSGGGLLLLSHTVS